MRGVCTTWRGGDALCRGSGWGLGDGGVVPAAGVCSEGGEGLVLLGVGSGGEVDSAAVDAEFVAADTVEISQRSAGGEVLVAQVGVADVGRYEGVADEGFDYGGVDTDRDVTADALFGPVPYGTET